jgi:hypothetical protein
LIGDGGVSRRRRPVRREEELFWYLVACSRAAARFLQEYAAGA